MHVSSIKDQGKEDCKIVIRKPEKFSRLPLLPYSLANLLNTENIPSTSLITIIDAVFLIHPLEPFVSFTHIP